jgi:hypothetical protein
LMHSKLTTKCGLNVNVRYTLAFRKLQTLLVHRSLQRSIVLKVCTRELWSRLPVTVWALQWPNLQQWPCWRTVSQLTTWLTLERLVLETTDMLLFLTLCSRTSGVLCMRLTLYHTIPHLFGQLTTTTRQLRSGKSLRRLIECVELAKTPNAATLNLSTWLMTILSIWVDAWASSVETAKVLLNSWTEWLLAIYLVLSKLY